jgi:hypothetical protein
MPPKTATRGMLPRRVTRVVCLLHACKCNDHTHLRVYKHARPQVRLGKRCTIEGFAPEIKHALTTHVKPGPGGRKYLDVDLNTVKSAGFDSVFAPRGNRDKNGVQFDEYVTPFNKLFYKNDCVPVPLYSIVFYSVMLTSLHRSRVSHLSAIPYNTSDTMVKR